MSYLFIFFQFHSWGNLFYYSASSLSPLIFLFSSMKLSSEISQLEIIKFLNPSPRTHQPPSVLINRYLREVHWWRCWQLCPPVFLNCYNSIQNKSEQKAPLKIGLVRKMNSADTWVNVHDMLKYFVTDELLEIFKELGLHCYIIGNLYHVIPYWYKMEL